jgi:hypothetical protein
METFAGRHAAFAIAVLLVLSLIVAPQHVETRRQTALIKDFGQAGVWTPKATVLAPVVDIEEDVYTYVTTGDADPMWASGAPGIVRIGGNVFAPGWEKVEGDQPVNNVRWSLWHRDSAGWRKDRTDTERTREPVSIAAAYDGRVFISANPGVNGAPNGATTPKIFQFSATAPTAAPSSFLPTWPSSTIWNDHSYRAFASDGATGELFLSHNYGYAFSEWSYRNAAGTWSKQGRLNWPIGVYPSGNQSDRLGYAPVVLRNKAVHYLGVSSVWEPVPAWHSCKAENPGYAAWDWVFRKLYYAQTSDITTTPFSSWVEIANVDATAGRISAGDMWLAPNGDVHLLWTETSIESERIQARFFPTLPPSKTLKYALVKNGRVILRRTLTDAVSEEAGIIGTSGRFHATAAGRLFVVYYARGRDGGVGALNSENRILEILPGGVSDAVTLPLARPFRQFFTATERGGSPPSGVMDLFGTPVGKTDTISYAKVRLFGKREGPVNQ